MASSSPSGALLFTARDSVRRSDHDGVAVGICDPQLPMLCVGVDVHVQDDARLKLASACDGGVEIVYLEPQQDAVAYRTRGIAHVTVVMVDIPSVELKDQAVRAPLGAVKARINQSLVFAAGMPLLHVAVTALAAKETLIKLARSFNVATHDEGLRSHDQTNTT